jgi:nucleoside-diphosphate-sugar epimerase
MRVVITGASGNLGTALLRELASTGHAVEGVVRRPPPPVGPYAGVRWTGLDLTSRDAEESWRLLARGADAVVHLAWALQPMRREDYLRKADVETSAMVVRAALEEGVPYVLQASSVAAYAARGTEALVGEDWPLGGIPNSAYSRHKTEVEDELDRLAREFGADRIAVVRPCLVGQYAAGGPLLRCGLPAWLPAALVDHLPVAPLDPTFGIQLVHAADVASAVRLAVEQRASGAFNLAGEHVLRGMDLVEALGSRPSRALRGHARRGIAVAWRAHLTPLDPGWVDMALSSPWMATTRAREVLGWQPRHDARAVLRELLIGMAVGAGSPSPALRPRRVWPDLRRSLRHGSVARRTRS